MAEQKMEGPSFFDVVHSPYYICIGNYEQKSAGIRALYYLCHVLNGQGQEAYILGADLDVTHLRAPRLQRKDFIRHQQGKQIPIMVYPEVVPGNPYKMPHVVRWLLNKAGHLGGDEIFHETEMVFAYTADYIPEGHDLPLLSIPVVDCSIFHNRETPHDSQRQGRVYYAHKYLANGYELTEHVKGAKSLCQDVKITPDELASILRSSELMYCYEPSSIIGEALNCGCPVVIIPSVYTEENLSYTIAGEGIASTPSDEDIAYAKSTISIAQDNNFAFHGHCWQHLRNFIKATQTEFSARQKEMNGSSLVWGDEVFELLNKISSDTENKPRRRRGFNDKLWRQKNVLLESHAAIMAERMANWQYQPT
ncbi:MAG: hypothetical protein JKY54_04270, partial [Flavobacteriales bacterium]|nr:hypothetical protein [Flavobacteriales bacterium]